MPDRDTPKDEFAHFVVLFNFVGAKEAKERFIEALKGEDYLGDLGLDSMDFLIIGMWLCTWWGVPTEVSKTLSGVPQNIERSPKDGQVATVSDFFTFLDSNKTICPPSLEQAIRDYS